jgi:pyridoxal phosphate enzyme (YggS family)
VSAAGSVAEQVAGHLASVRARIATAARDAGRAPDAVTLVAVSKTVPLEAVEAALAAGQLVLGENRAQELRTKAEAFASRAPAPIWHFVGQLQRNKVRLVAPYVTCWQSIDRAELGPELARFAPEARVLVQVNVGAEPQKAGCDPASAPGLVDELRAGGLDVTGLMTVPPAGVDPRPYFAALRELGEGLDLPDLSMGMTADFEAAIGEGATIVRIGSAVFGARREGGGLRR